MVTLISSITINRGQDVSGTGSANSATGSTTVSIDEMVTLRLQPYVDRADSLAAQINAKSTKIAAYQEMQTKLTAVASAMSGLTKVTGGSGTNAFEARTATVSATLVESAASSTPSSPNALVSILMEDGAEFGSHTIVVDQIAKAESRKTDVVSKDSWASSGGSFSINGETITLDSGANITAVANAINNSNSGVKASLVNTGNGNVVLVLTANDTNAPITMTDNSGSILGDLGLLNAGNVIQEAQSALVTVDGVSGIVSDTNELKDVIPGATINLLASDPDTKIIFAVEQDMNSLAEQITAFVDAYNDWKDFVAQQTALEGTSAASTAYLFGDGSLRSADLEIANILSSVAKGAGSDGATLGTIGISFDSNNKLVINQTTLLKAMQNNYASVSALFQNAASITAGDSGTSLSVGINMSSFYGELKFEYTDSSNWKVYDLSNGGSVDVSSSFTLSNGYFSGVSGSEFSGLGVSSKGTGNLGTISFSMGLANQLYKAANSHGNSATGSVQKIVSQEQSTVATMTTRYNTMMEQAQSYADYLVLEYGKMSAKIAASNQMLMTLQALIDAENN